ncbi:MAG: FAD binding domain-containing protein [Oscillospiraceae bacterium]|nr:FAD binding domain-containing protein [Oscillospiraceae bacterium]
MLPKIYSPQTLPELFRALQALTPQSKIIAGGTDLVIKLHQGDVAPDALLYLGALEQSRAISARPDGLEIGTMATMFSLAGNDLLTGPYAAIKHAAAGVGSVQIRNSATIGGNIANASPAADLTPVLWLLGADAVIASPAGKLRRQPVSEVVTGIGKHSLAHNEAIVRFVIPSPGSQTQRSAYLKLGSRKALTISRIGLAAACDLDEQGVVSRFELVAGAISPTPIHVEKAEKYLVGKKPCPDCAAHIGQLLSDLIWDVIPDRPNTPYKAAAAHGIAEDLFEILFG